jgi:hypothetical protein
MGGCSSEFVGALREAAFDRLRRSVRDDHEALFLTGALVEMVIRWVETGFEEDARVLAESYASFAKRVGNPSREQAW